MNRRTAFSLIRYILSLILLIFFGLGIFFYWAIGSSLPRRSTLGVVGQPGIEAKTPKDVVTVASYNIGHGQGIKERAWDHRDKEITLKQLKELSAAMVDIDADIFMLQEVDLDSNRTYHIDQLDFIKQRTRHPFHACATVWEKNYVPFPYWPPANHIGYVRSANCILSRYPLSNHERIIFDKPESNPFWYNLGYIDRGIQRVDAQIGDRKIAILNVHLDAWDKQAREKQIRVVYDYMKEIDIPLILGGDFNTIPPEAQKRRGFLDDPDADYQEENTLTWLFKSAPALKTPQRSAKIKSFAIKPFTFPANAPDRWLDHIFLLGEPLTLVDFAIAAEAETASDHLPVVAKIKISK